jgi:nitronate monooxygenase
MAQDAYKQMLVDCRAADVVYTDAVSGTNANFLWPSLERAGFSRDQLSVNFGKGRLHGIADEARAWRDIWSAGQGVSTIHDLPPVGELIERLAQQYRTACELPPSPALAG